MNTALGLLRQFEGFRETPYWDVNAYRTGYGSDTITRSDGRVVPVQPGMTVTRDDAERDLQRRVNTEFMPRAASAVGDAWRNLSPNQQAALTSITYNYGSLPKGVAAAVQSGDPNAVAAAIRALGSHNDGINANRRAQEAAIYLGGDVPNGAPMTPTVSTQSPGLLGPQQPQKRGLLGMDTEKLNRIGLAMMAASGYQPFQPLIQAQFAEMRDEKKAKRDEQRRNQTVEFLRRMNPEIAGAVEAGVLNPSDAYKMATGSADPNVQSSAMLPDMTGTVLTMRDGSIKVVTAGGEELTGQAAMDFVNNAQSNYTDQQRSIYGAREGGKLEAQTELGAAAAAATSEGKMRPEMAREFMNDARLVRSNLVNINDAIAAIDGGAQSGIVYNMLPNVTQASASLQNAMDRMGLDVIGSVTFGALSEGEMRLAMETAVPRNLAPEQLREWLIKKRDAQQKALEALNNAALHFASGGSLEDYARGSSKPAQAAPSGGDDPLGLR